MFSQKNQQGPYYRPIITIFAALILINITSLKPNIEIVVVCEMQDQD